MSNSDSSESSDLSSNSSENSSEEDSGSVSDNDVDDRDALLPDAFKEPENKLVISDWGLKKLRKLFMGQPINKEDRVLLTEKYFCSPQLFELFQAPKFGSSPLSLLKFAGSNASRDASFIHADVNFAMRILISLYEKQLTLKGKFAPESKVGNKLVKAGPYVDLEFPFKTGFQFPDPRKCMDDISDRSLVKFKRRFGDQDPDFADNVCRYAMGYKEAFLQLAASVSSLVQFGERSSDALDELRSGLDVQVDTVGDIARIVGNASQSLSTLREKEYLAKTDAGFKNFLSMRKSSLSQEEIREEKLSPFNEKKLIKTAKDYSKMKRALASVTKDRTTARAKLLKLEKEKDKKSPSSSSNPKAGPSKPRKPFKGKQPNKNKKGKKSSDKKDSGEEED